MIYIDNKNKKTVFRFGELFHGPGGIGLAAKLAHLSGVPEYEIQHVWANDYDESACKTYAHNILKGNPSAKSYHAPVQELDIDSLGEIDAFAFGFPCNDFSIVGKQKGLDGNFGALYTYGVKVIDQYNPLFFVAENVGGLQSANDGEAFKSILNDLKNAGRGYRLTPHLYKFEEYGVPQNRHRIIIVGIRNDLGLDFKIPYPTTINNHITARHAIEQPPISEDAANHEKTRHSEKVIKMLQHIPAGKNAWYEGIPEYLRLKVKGGAKLSQIYKRLDPNKPSYTVTGSGGGGTHVYHWSEPRALTNRERARLQSFPDDFIFLGSKEKARQQIGMAVPPMGAKVIFEAILRTFAGIEYEHLEKSNWFEKTNIKL